MFVYRRVSVDVIKSRRCYGNVNVPAAESGLYFYFIQSTS